MIPDPRPKRGETWENYLDRKYREIDELDVVAVNCEPWEVDELRSRYSQLWYEIECAKRMVEEK